MSYYRLADVILLFYACDQPDTFFSIEETWLPQIERDAKGKPIILVKYTINAFMLKMGGDQYFCKLYSTLIHGCSSSSLHAEKVSRMYQSGANMKIMENDLLMVSRMYQSGNET